MGYINVLAAIYLCTSSSATGQTVLGVWPIDQELYQPTSYTPSGEPLWHCLSDPTIVLKYSQINDDYCDCPDGLDEPGTNACPYGIRNMFYCANEGHFSSLIESFKLNDGVCDYDRCCDGSDEYKTMACPNKCKEINARFVAYEGAFRKNIGKALAVKLGVLDKAAVARAAVAKELKDLESNIQALERKKNDIKEVPNSANSPPPEVAPDQVEVQFAGLESVAQKYSERVSTLNAKVEQLEKILVNLARDYNPNFNDQGVKNSLRSFENYESAKVEDEETLSSLEKEFKGALDSIGSMGIKEPSLGSYFETIYKLIKRMVMPDLIILSTADVDQPSEEVQAIDTEIKSVKDRARALGKDLESNYGPQDVLRGILDLQVDAKFGGYDYHISLQNGIYQDNTFLGSFKQFSDGNKLHFREGSKCWNGPERSAVVQLACCYDTHVLSVSEPEKCEYVIQVTHPIACEDMSSDELRALFRIDFANFGDSSE